MEAKALDPYCMINISGLNMHYERGTHKTTSDKFVIGLTHISSYKNWVHYQFYS
jgi:hypothetical protein